MPTQQRSRITHRAVVVALLAATAAALGMAGKGFEVHSETHSDDTSDVQSTHEEHHEEHEYTSGGHFGPFSTDPDRIIHPDPDKDMQDIDAWLDENRDKYEHSDDAYSVHVAGALVALALVVVAV